MNNTISILLKNFKKWLLPFSVALIVFIGVAIAYFSPIIDGKVIRQSDIVQHKGAAKETEDFRKKYDDEPYWTNSSFGGIPTYTVGSYYPHDYLSVIDKTFRFLPRPADLLFLYFINFFILLLILKIDWKLAIVGALGFGLSTYLLIILGVGHNAKAHAIAYIPLVLSGMLLIFRNRYLIGFIITTLAMGLEMMAGHPQVTYYLMFMILFWGIIQLYDAIKKKTLPHFFKKTTLFGFALLLGFGFNASKLMALNEYSKLSTRGKSELTISPSGDLIPPSNGLSKNYITEYSYGIAETFNLLIPRFMGGTSNDFREESSLTQFLEDSVNQGLDPDSANYLFRISSMYWGKQPIVAAPAYIGALFIFLFVLALFLVKNNLKKWLLLTVIFSILLSWGHHLSFLTDFFINYVPFYNKFRAVSSIQILAELAIPLLGIIGLSLFLSNKVTLIEKQKALKNTTYIVGGIALLFTLIGKELFSFETPLDIEVNSQIPGYLDAIVTDRKALFFGDSLRTLLFVCGLGAVLWAYSIQKLKKPIVILAIGGLLLFDLIGVGKRYVNDRFFVNPKEIRTPFVKTEIDTQILKDSSNFRVIDYSKNTIADASTSYYHSSLGGYNAAKLRRYQELYDFYIVKEHQEVLNMLNTKYLIQINKENKRTLTVNSAANGNAWFVDSLITVNNANDEIKALGNLNSKTETVINLQNFSNENLAKTYKSDSLNSIQLLSYKPNSITYRSQAKTDQFAVFSEIYYAKGWRAYIDETAVSHYQVNYVLRGLKIPAGTHTVKFVFEPKVIQKGSNIALLSYFLFLLFPPFLLFIKNKRKS